jgi:hypothetical protein
MRVSAAILEAIETWVPIPGTDDMYDVSSEGNVRSWKNAQYGKRSSPKIIKPIVTRGGYLCVHLHAGKVVRTERVHRLVLSAFNGPIPDGMDVAHMDGVKTNNRLTNLRAATRAENESDKLRHGTDCRGEKQWQAKLTCESVCEIRRLISSGLSCVEIGRKFGVSRASIRSIAIGKNWAHVPHNHSHGAANEG